MDAAGIPALVDAIRHLHGCEARHVETVPVRELHPDGRVVWEGDVEVFDLTGQPLATRAYAWSHVTTGTKRKFYAVLHAGPIDSPRKAVQAVRFALRKTERQQALYTELASLVAESSLPSAVQPSAQPRPVTTGVIPFFDKTQRKSLSKIEYGKAVVRFVLAKSGKGRTRDILDDAEIVDPEIEKGQIYSAINAMFRDKELDADGSQMSRTYFLRQGVP